MTKKNLSSLFSWGPRSWRAALLSIAPARADTPLRVRDETIKIAQPIMNGSPEIAARTYEEPIGAFSLTAAFPRAASTP